MKILVRDITVDEMPITSGEVILVRTNHKRYPEMNPMMVSTKI
jgi:hypothetical protein